MPASLRQMTVDDVGAVARLQQRTFGRPPRPGVAEPRIAHLVETDPGGAWVAEEAGELRGAALAIVREGLWGLSLLIVDPDHQSGGTGRALFDASLSHGADAAAGLIVASEDARALRLYSRAGFDLRPAVEPTGHVLRRPAADPAVRRGRWPEDRSLVDAAGRFVRGASHAPDVPVWLALGCALYVHDDGGFAVRFGGEMKAVAARDPAVAGALLRTALRDVPEGIEAEAGFITAGQQWAVEVALDAGLSLKPCGAIMARGDIGPLAPYLPSGAYL